MGMFIMSSGSVTGFETGGILIVGLFKDLL
jgi:hypothetical protein